MAFNCECIKCGHKVTSEEHCAEIKCPKCGGQMRREDRPGPGEDLAKDGIKFIKEDSKKQIAYGIVWEPGFVDTQGHWASEEHIEEAAHDYLQYHRGVKLSHGLNITKEASIVQSYIAPVDFDCGDYKVKKGSWVVALKIINDQFWKAVESGEIMGLSAGGTLTFV